MDRGESEIRPQCLGSPVNLDRAISNNVRLCTALMMSIGGLGLPALHGQEDVADLVEGGGELTEGQGWMWTDVVFFVFQVFAVIPPLS